MPHDRTELPPLAALRSPPPTGSQSNPGSAVSVVLEQADRLQSLAVQMEQFLQSQFSRLESTLIQSARTATAATSTPAAARGYTAEEVQQMRQAWEAERHLDRQTLHEDAARLAEAWERLEQEQRELLKFRATLKSNATTPRAAPNNENTNGGSPAREQPRSATPAPPFATEPLSPAANNKNQMQFQQLRREMLEHIRQARKR